MRRAGFEAFHVKGGTKQLMRAVAAELAAPVRGRP
jgi:hypothetical protein